MSNSASVGNRTCIPVLALSHSQSAEASFQETLETGCLSVRGQPVYRQVYCGHQPAALRCCAYQPSPPTRPGPFPLGFSASVLYPVASTKARNCCMVTGVRRVQRESVNPEEQPERESPCCSGEASSGMPQTRREAASHTNKLRAGHQVRIASRHPSFPCSRILKNGWRLVRTLGHAPVEGCSDPPMEEWPVTRPSQ